MAQREVLDLRGAAEYLGVSMDKMSDYARDGVVPAFKLGNRWRFRRALLNDWMDREIAAATAAKVGR